MKRLLVETRRAGRRTFLIGGGVFLLLAGAVLETIDYEKQSPRCNPFLLGLSME